jgi:hypothetical protein
MAILLIATAVMLIGGLAVIPALQEVQADRCVTSEDQSTDVTTTTCFFGTDENAIKDDSKEAKESCKDEREQGEVDKCSSSQTGSGEFCNWVRERRDNVTVVFGDGPSCNEERHLLK